MTNAEYENIPDFLVECIEKVKADPDSSDLRTLLAAYINSAEIDHNVNPTLRAKIRDEVLYA